MKLEQLSSVGIKAGKISEANRVVGTKRRYMKKTRPKTPTTTFFIVRNRLVQVSTMESMCEENNRPEEEDASNSNPQMIPILE